MPKDDSGKRKRKAAQPPNHIPRPPNAWIIYRARKLQYLKQTMNLGDAMQQSMASKLIGQMWKEEPLEVREYYERLAEGKKAEHAAKYPDYKYKPKTKAQKQQERESRIASSESHREPPENEPGPSSRPATIAPPSAHLSPTPLPTTSQAIPPLVYHPHPITAMYYPHLYYNNAGPTPPLSAAPTDGDSDEQPETPNNASPSTSSTEKGASTSTGPTIHNPRPMHPAIPDNLLEPAAHLAPQPQLPDFAHWSIPEEAPPPGSSTQWTTQGTPALQEHPLMDSLTFSLPTTNDTVGNDNFWNSFLNPDPLDSFNNVLPTDDPSVFQLSNFEPNTSGELELSGSDMALNFARLFDQEFPASSTFSQDFGPTFPTAPQNEFANLPLLFTDNSIPPSQVVATQPLPNIDFTSYQADDYLHLDASSTSSAVETPMAASDSSSVNYVPPSGAALAGTRRVGGSWKIPVVESEDATSDFNPAGIWGVPTR